MSSRGQRSPEQFMWGPRGGPIPDTLRIPNQPPAADLYSHIITGMAPEHFCASNGSNRVKGSRRLSRTKPTPQVASWWFNFHPSMPTQQQPNQAQLDKGDVVVQDVDADVHDSKKLKCPLWFVVRTLQSQHRKSSSVLRHPSHSESQLSDKNALQNHVARQHR